MAKKDVYPAGVQNFKFMEMTYEICQCEDSYVSAFAAKPDNKTQIWTVWRQPDNEAFGSTNSLSKWTAAGRLVYDLVKFGEVEDVISFEIVDLGGIDKLESSNIADIAVARKGSRLLVIDDEIIAYSTLLQLPNGHCYIKGVLRGVFDTVPAKHGAESNVFFIRSGEYANVTTGGPVAMAGTSTKEQYNITTSTVDPNEDFDYTKVKELKTSRRTELPSVPGRIRISSHLQMSLGLFCSVQSVGSCSETYTLTADQLETLQTNLTVLQENNEKLKTLLMESNQDLTIASEQSDSLNNQIVVLDSQLTESQNQIETLKQQLETLKQQTIAQTSLQTANEELASASASFKKYEKEQDRIQSKLRMQKNIWEVIAGVIAGYAVTK